MNFFKRPHLFRRNGPVTYENGYPVHGYEDITLPADVQTTEDTATTDEQGTEAVQRLKVFCDFELFVENSDKGIRGDRLWFQNKWFQCVSSRLSENTILRHWTATFVECAEQDPPPGTEEDSEEDTGEDTGENTGEEGNDDAADTTREEETG